MNKKIKWILILAVVGGGVYFWLQRSNVSADEGSGAVYDVETVTVRDIRMTVESTGEVEPRNRLDVKPAIAGRLEELLVQEGETVDKGEILGWISSTERATLLDAALATSQKEYDYWANLYKPSPLISPLGGTIIARSFEPGQSISTSDAVVVIADDLIIVANLDETDIGQIQVGQAVTVALEAYPDREFDCTVEKIAYDATTVSSVTMYEVDVCPVRLPPFARSGMTANLEFVVKEKAGVLALPASAVQQMSVTSTRVPPDLSGESGKDRKALMLERMKARGLSEAEIQERLARGGPPKDGSGGAGRTGVKRVSGSAVEYYVLVASDDPQHPKQLPIRVGVSDGSYTEVLEGLNEGDEVLVPRLNLSSKKASSSLFGAMGGGPPR